MTITDKCIRYAQAKNANGKLKVIKEVAKEDGAGIYDVIRMLMFCGVNVSAVKSVYEKSRISREIYELQKEGMSYKELAEIYGKDPIFIANVIYKEKALRKTNQSTAESL